MSVKFNSVVLSYIRPYFYIGFPFLLLGLSPENIPLSSSFIFVLILFYLINTSITFRLRYILIFFSIFLYAVSLSIYHSISWHGAKGLFFFLVVVIPPALIFANKLKDKDVVFISVGFVLLSFLFGIYSIIFSSRFGFGISSYHWPAIVSSISFLLLLYNFTLKRSILFIPIMAINIHVISISFAEQSIPILLAGLLIISISGLRQKNAIPFLTLLIIVSFSSTIFFNLLEFGTFRFVLSNVTHADGIEDFLGDRYSIYSLAINTIIENKILGIGFGQFETEFTRIGRYPHNIFLSVWLSFGLIGFLVFSYYLVKVVSTLLLAKNDNRQYSDMLLIIFSCFFVSSLFSGDIVGYRGHWFLFFMLYSYYSRLKSK